EQSNQQEQRAQEQRRQDQNQQQQRAEQQQRQGEHLSQQRQQQLIEQQQQRLTQYPSTSGSAAACPATADSTVTAAKAYGTVPFSGRVISSIYDRQPDYDRDPYFYTAPIYRYHRG